MRKSLLMRAAAKFAGGLIASALLLFLPAGTMEYPNAWLLICALFLPMLAAGAVMLFRAPALLEKRLSAKEKVGAQRQVVLMSLVMFVGGFVIAGLDFRFGWSALPGWVSIAAVCVLLISYGMYVEVMRENAYLSRTVEVQPGQKVVDTGLYGVVRHPMYLATMFLFLSMPLILGSWYAFAVFLCYPLLLVRRILSEEKVLRAELCGYKAYMSKVRYRLIPFVW